MIGAGQTAAQGQASNVGDISGKAATAENRDGRKFRPWQKRGILGMRDRKHCVAIIGFRLCMEESRGITVVQPERMNY